MKIALVSPYDYPYPGGVTAHISHLEREFTKLGHEVKVIAPSSSDQEELARDNVYKIGSVISIPANGSVARITLSLRMSGRVKRSTSMPLGMMQYSPAKCRLTKLFAAGETTTRPSSFLKNRLNNGLE